MNITQEQERQRQLQLILPKEIYQNFLEHFTFYTPIPPETFDILQEFLTELFSYIIVQFNDDSTNDNFQINVSQHLKLDGKMVYSNFILGNFHTPLDYENIPHFPHGMRAMLQYSSGSFLNHNDLIFMFICFENHNLIRVYKNGVPITFNTLNNGVITLDLSQQDLTSEHLEDFYTLLNVFKQYLVK